MKRAIQYLQFSSAFIDNPLEMGSVVPSSRFLSDSMLRGLDFSMLNHILEYGPGTGAFTRHLSQRLNNDSTRLQLVEKNPLFIERLEQLYPEAEIFVDSALNALKQNQHYEGKVGLVISSLPFTNIPWTETKETIEKTHHILKANGIFRMYIYCHTMPLQKNRKLINLLKELFTQVDWWVEWRNFPPAYVVHCEK